MLVAAGRTAACAALLLALACGGAGESPSLSSVSITHLASATPDALTFRVCNNGYQPIARVEFEAVTFAEGDATPRPMGNGPLSTDSVLAQANCGDFTYDGPFTLLDSVAGRVTAVILAPR